MWLACTIIGQAREHSINQCVCLCGHVCNKYPKAQSINSVNKLGVTE